jgi:predicted nucleic acid-binding protein
VRYLLDTTLLIDHTNGHPPAMATLARLFDEGGELFVCDVVVSEALSGGTDEHLHSVARLIDALEYVATSPHAARWAASSRLSRHRAGGKLALADALIAGVAATLEATIVTRNRRDFERQGVPVLAY